MKLPLDFASLPLRAFVVLGSACLVSLVSCASVPDSGRYTIVLEPDYAIYRDNVDNYLQRRCGTLDCHGQPGRAYRIYGNTGYRLYTVKEGTLVSGDQPTEEAERRANFQAFVTLEPEEMSRVMATQGADPNKLLVLRKPMRFERHKGGPAMSEGDPGYRCVVAWLQVPVANPDGTIIPVEERVFSQNAKTACADAAAFP